MPTREYRNHICTQTMKMMGRPYNYTKIKATSQSSGRMKPEGQNKRGRPRMTSRLTVEAEATVLGHPWGTFRILAQDRLR